MINFICLGSLPQSTFILVPISKNTWKEQYGWMLTLFGMICHFCVFFENPTGARKPCIRARPAMTSQIPSWNSSAPQVTKRQTRISHFVRKGWNGSVPEWKSEGNGYQAAQSDRVTQCISISRQTRMCLLLKNDHYSSMFPAIAFAICKNKLSFEVGLASI